MNAVTRKVGATWFIPSENEWYKAAYHKNDGVTGNYWAYPTSTFDIPRSAQPPGIGAPTPSNTVNSFADDGVANTYDNGYAVTGSTTYSSSQNYLTEVGAYEFSSSPYGTFDQGGNVWEWNEALISGSFRGLRGGTWGIGLAYNLISSTRIDYVVPTSEDNTDGFRVAHIPGPPTLVGDISGDGEVDIADFTLWADAFGETTPGQPEDLSGDGQVDIGDFTIWGDHFGDTVGAFGSPNMSSIGVPEPSTYILLVIGTILVAAFGWRQRQKT